MSTGDCPLGLRLNSGAAVDPKQKMLSVVLVQQRPGRIRDCLKIKNPAKSS
jgi:hypothetical protein